MSLLKPIIRSLTVASRSQMRITGVELTPQSRASPRAFISRCSPGLILPLTFSIVSTLLLTYAMMRSACIGSASMPSRSSLTVSAAVPTSASRMAITVGTANFEPFSRVYLSPVVVGAENAGSLRPGIFSSLNVLSLNFSNISGYNVISASSERTTPMSPAFPSSYAAVMSCSLICPGLLMNSDRIGRRLSLSRTYRNSSASMPLKLLTPSMAVTCSCDMTVSGWTV